MKSKEELANMSHEELLDFADSLQFKAMMYDREAAKSDRMKELLAAIGIVYETYKREK